MKGLLRFWFPSVSCLFPMMVNNDEYFMCLFLQVAQGLIVGVLSRRFSEPFLLRGAICVIASAYGLLVSSN